MMNRMHCLVALVFVPAIAEMDSRSGATYYRPLFAGQALSAPLLSQRRPAAPVQPAPEAAVVHFLYRCGYFQDFTALLKKFLQNEGPEMAEDVLLERITAVASRLWLGEPVHSQGLFGALVNRTLDLAVRHAIFGVKLSDRFAQDFFTQVRAQPKWPLESPLAGHPHFQGLSPDAPLTTLVAALAAELAANPMEDLPNQATNSGVDSANLAADPQVLSAQLASDPTGAQQLFNRLAVGYANLAPGAWLLRQTPATPTAPITHTLYIYKGMVPKTAQMVLLNIATGREEASEQFFRLLQPPGLLRRIWPIAPAPALSDPFISRAQEPTAERSTQALPQSLQEQRDQMLETLRSEGILEVSAQSLSTILAILFFLDASPEWRIQIKKDPILNAAFFQSGPLLAALDRIIVTITATATPLNNEQTLEALHEIRAAWHETIPMRPGTAMQEALTGLILKQDALARDIFAARARGAQREAISYQEAIGRLESRRQALGRGAFVLAFEQMRVRELKAAYPLLLKSIRQGLPSVKIADLVVGALVLQGSGLVEIKTVLSHGRYKVKHENGKVSDVSLSTTPSWVSWKLLAGAVERESLLKLHRMHDRAAESEHNPAPVANLRSALAMFRDAFADVKLPEGPPGEKTRYSEIIRLSEGTTMMPHLHWSVRGNAFTLEVSGTLVFQGAISEGHFFKFESQKDDIHVAVQLVAGAPLQLQSPITASVPIGSLRDISLSSDAAVFELDAEAFARLPQALIKGEIPGGFFSWEFVTKPPPPGNGPVQRSA